MRTTHTEKETNPEWGDDRRRASEQGQGDGGSYRARGMAACNGSAGTQRISGSSAELACGRHIADALYTPLNPSLRDHGGMLEAARKLGHAAMRCAIRITTHGGAMQLVDYHAIPLTDAADTLIGGLFIAHDFRQFEGTASEAG